MIKYYYENATAYEQRLFKIDGNNYWMVYPHSQFHYAPQKINKGNRHLLKTQYRQMPDLFAVLMGVKL